MPLGNEFASPLFSLDTNAPPEGLLNGDPYIKLAVMFGRGRFNPGIIVDPKPELVFDPEDQEKLAELRNMIWCVKYILVVHSPIGINT